MPKRTVAFSLLLTLLMVISLAPYGCGGLQQKGPLTPLVRGWEQFFMLDWQAGQGGQQSVV